MLLEKRVAVVIPAYREERLVARVLARQPDWIDTIVVVDDGSPDHTYAAACEAARCDARVQVIRLAFNQGVGAAIMRGYARATREGAEVIAVMAGDDQMDPDELANVCLPVARGEAGYAKGNRLTHPEAHRMPWLRRAGTRALGRVTGLIAGVPGLDDAQCGYTAVSTEALARIDLHDVYPRYGYPNDLLLRLAAARVAITQPTVRPIYADEVSGLKIHKVIGPISGILLRGLGRRLLQVALPSSRSMAMG